MKWWQRALNRFLTIKSITTLILTCVFGWLGLTGAIAAEAFQDIFYIVIAFYFGSSLEKTANATGTETE